MRDKHYLIYGLIDPVSMMIRYVGKSSVGVRRADEHRRKGRSGPYVRRWVESLLSTGLDYDITILEETTDVTLNSAEQWWIAYGRACGWPLTNLTDGGDGGRGLRMSEEAKRKIGDANRNPSAESRTKMSFAAKNRSAETRALLSNGRTGKKHSSEARIKISIANSNRSPETLAKLSFAAKNMSAETRKKIGQAGIGKKYHLGHKHSEETKSKLRAAWIRRKLIKGQ